MSWPAIFLALTTAVIGVIGTLLLAPGQIRKLRSETRKIDIDAEDAHWERIITAQTESLVAPLRDKVVDLEAKVEKQGELIEQLRTGYWRAIQHIRDLRRWGHDPTAEPMPAPPSEIADDI